MPSQSERELQRREHDAALDAVLERRGLTSDEARALRERITIDVDGDGRVNARLALGEHPVEAVADLIAAVFPPQARRDPQAYADARAAVAAKREEKQGRGTWQQAIGRA